MQFTEYETIWKETAIYPKDQGLTYTAIGLGNEAGEYLGKIKKAIRDGYLDKIKAADELGDVLWYVTAAANELGYSLEAIAAMNYAKLKSRKERGVLSGSGDSR